MHRRLPLHGGDGFQQGDVFGADFDAVAGFAAVADAALLHQRFQTLVLQSSADGVIVEEARLTDDGSADEFIGRGVLRAGLETAATTDAARKYSDGRYDVEVDRRNRDDDPSPSEARPTHLLTR